MTFDSVDEWNQTISGQYRNEHPFMHSMTIALMRKMWDSPASMALLQTGLLALAVGLSVRVLLRGARRRRGLIVYALAFFCFPVFGIYSVTIWKDVLFSIGFFLFAIVWVDRPLLNYFIGINWKRAIATGIGIAYFASLRHNGVVIAALIPVIVLLRRDLGRRNRAALACSVAVTYAVVQLILPQILHVSSKRVPFLRELTVLQLVAAVVVNNGVITPDERITINVVSPVNQLAAHYNCYISTSAVMSLPNLAEDVFDDPAFIEQFNTAASHILIRNIPIVVADRACMTMHMLGFGQPRWSYLYETGISPNTVGLSLNPVWPLRRTLLAFLAWSEEYPQRLLFWNYAPFLIMLIVAWRNAGSGPIRDIALLVLTTAAAMCLFGPARDHRYMFPVVLIAPFLFTYCLALKTTKEDLK